MAIDDIAGGDSAFCSKVTGHVDSALSEPRLMPPCEGSSPGS